MSTGELADAILMDLSQIVFICPLLCLNQSMTGLLQELEVANRRLSRSAQETATAEKENRALKQTLKYLQAELVKAGKKVQQ